MTRTSTFSIAAAVLASASALALAAASAWPSVGPIPDAGVPAGLTAPATAVPATAVQMPEGGQEVRETEMIDLALRGAHFVPNQGQWEDETVLYGFRTRGLDVAFRESSLTMHLRRELPREDGGHDHPLHAEDHDALTDAFAGAAHEPDEPAEFEHLTLEVTFPGSNSVMPRGADPRDTAFNYFIGDDESRWASDVRSYSAIVFEEIYDGIDLHVMGLDDGVLKYEFRCAPGSDHSRVQVRYDGIDGLRIDEETGDLLIETSFGTLRDGAPLVWEGDYHLPDERIAEHTIPAHFEVIDQQTYSFALLSEPDPSRPLVIDPELEWMTYLGGSQRDDGLGIAVDDAGNALVTGWTSSIDFAGANNSPYSAVNVRDAFALKVSPSGQLQWMTYLGGSGHDRGNGITVDSAGNALVTGSTSSSNFAGANNSCYGCGSPNDDAFALKVSPSGQLQWMTYLGGSGRESGYGIAADSAGNALVTGFTNSTDFAGANSSNPGLGSAFALKVSPSGELEWMYYLGGSGGDSGRGIAVDSAGNALVTGSTWSADFAGRNNSSYSAPVEDDGFVLKISSSGQIEWMTYLGGSSRDRGWGVAVDSAGNALVTGWTQSTDFAGANNSYPGGRWSGFALKISPSGQLEWMTYLGGSDWDSGHDIAVDSAGNTLVTGETLSTDFAGANNSFHGGADAFALKVSPSGQLEWMIYLGGNDRDQGGGIALDGAGNALVTGRTQSTDFAGANNSFHGGVRDAFIVKLALAPDCIADWNGDGEVDINDLFAYLDDFAAGDPRADLNNDGEIDINDFFIFLQEFEEGC